MMLTGFRANRVRRLAACTASWRISDVNVEDDYVRLNAVLSVPNNVSWRAILLKNNKRYCLHLHLCLTLDPTTLQSGSRNGEGYDYVELKRARA